MPVPATTYATNLIPHYFTIDSDGVLQDEQIGSGSNIEGKLKKLVARAREAQKTAPPSPTKSIATTQGGSGGR